MVFTSEQEQAIIEENMPKIYRAVDNYTAKFSANVARVPYDEFVQEVSLMFLLYIRNCNSMEEINRFPWCSAMNVMRNTVLVFQPMSCSKSHKTFKAVINNMPQTVSDDVLASATTDVNGMSKHWVDDKDTMMDFETFMDERDENTKRLVSMRYGGMTLKDIASQYGVNKSTVLRRIRTLADDYHEFLNDPDEEGD